MAAARDPKEVDAELGALVADMEALCMRPREIHEMKCHAPTRKGKRCQNRYGKCQYIAHAEYRKAQPGWAHPPLAKDPCDPRKLLSFCRECSSECKTK
jgi:hypothetical protein